MLKTKTKQTQQKRLKNGYINKNKVKIFKSVAGKKGKVSQR